MKLRQRSHRWEHLRMRQYDSILIVALHLTVTRGWAALRLWPVP
jgi:hypothetical protein